MAETLEAARAWINEVERTTGAYWTDQFNNPDQLVGYQPLAEEILAAVPEVSHFPMIVGIIYLALGLKKVAQYVADSEEHSLLDPLKGTALWALYGGVALYLLAHLAFRLRNIGSINRPRAVTAVLLVVAPLGAQYLPALAALGLLALLLGGLIAFEVVHYADARAAVRAEAAHH